MGARFAGHPPGEHLARIVNESPRHPTMQMWPEAFRWHDEWYDFNLNVRGSAYVLASVDESSDPGGKMGADHPIAWCHENLPGRVWYTALGHGPNAYEDERFLRHVTEGVRWAIGQTSFADE
jgi:hypothetical protein